MFKSRLKSKNLFRRSSSTQEVNDHNSQPSTTFPSVSPQSQRSPLTISPTTARTPKHSRSFTSLKDRRKKSAPPAVEKELPEELLDTAKDHQDASAKEESESLRFADETLENSLVSLSSVPAQTHSPAPKVVIEEPTPDSAPSVGLLSVEGARQAPASLERGVQAVASLERGVQVVASLEQGVQALDVEALVSDAARKQSLVSRADLDVIKALLHDDHLSTTTLPTQPSLLRRYTTASETTALNASMLNRKVWVKRPHAAATIVLIREDDLVDEAKEAILAKYRNQLSRHFDAPDITIRIISRDQPGERVLTPDEPLCRTIDSVYPGGQSVDEALIIDVPPRRTPRPSPRAHTHHSYQNHDTYNYYDPGSARPHESAADYFPPMPPINLGQPSPLLTNASHESHSHDSRKSHASHAAHERAMSVLNTGQVPPLPSPGLVGRRAHLAKQHGRPSHGRQQTTSPTALSSSVAWRSNRPRLDSTASADKHPQLGSISNTGTLPTPPAPKPIDPLSTPQTGTNPPTPRVSSPRPGGRPKKMRPKQKDSDSAPTSSPALFPGILDTSVPPINVLIVEDNMINMRLLEQFVRRLGVRWQTAVNGREAVTKWRRGGFHLVLMDIQLPIMSGLEATREIRRLERINGIGVFSSASSESPELAGFGGDGVKDGGGADKKVKEEVKEEDKLFEEGYSRLFKSPVIIVALTASNLQSDRHEALAAGCNDFLTKPVNFVWFERKVKEWGCMQALIDFDGWRKWKDFAELNGLKDPTKPTSGAGAPVKPARKVIAAANKIEKEDAEKGREKVSITATPTFETPKVPEPKTLDSGGLHAVGTGNGKPVETDDRDFASNLERNGNGRVEGLMGEKLVKEDSPDTVIHDTPPASASAGTNEAEKGEEAKSNGS